MNKFTIKAFKINFYQELVSLIETEQLPTSKRKFAAKQVICLSQTHCDQIGIILKGLVTIEYDSLDGRRIIINTLKENDIFGEILVFSKNSTFPYSIIANHETEVLFIKRPVLLSILTQHANLLEKFLDHIANSYMILNKYIKLISQRHIINKIAFYLIHYGGITANHQKFAIKTKTQIAEFLGIERQSLIRALNNLKKNAVIDYDLDYIYVKNYLYLVGKID